MKAAHTTHFGNERIATEHKQGRVNALFTQVSPYYDPMNNAMSLGLHHLWKSIAVRAARIRPSHTVLDLASGTGDLTALIAPKLGASGHLIQADINRQMLTHARDRSLNAGYERVRTVIFDGHAPPLRDASVDRILIAFGIRNFAEPERALRQLLPLLKPAGMLLILEFGQPHSKLLRTLYDHYSLTIIPKMARLMTQDVASYRYLVESIRQHPTQQQWCTIMRQCGYAEVDVHNLSGGIVALYRGWSPHSRIRASKQG